MSQSTFRLNFVHMLGDGESPKDTFDGYGDAQSWSTYDAQWLSVDERGVMIFGMSHKGECEVQVSPDTLLPASNRYRRVGWKVVGGMSFPFDRIRSLYISANSRMRCRVVNGGYHLVEVSTWSLASLSMKGDALHLIPFSGGEVAKIVDGVPGVMPLDFLSGYKFPLHSLVSLSVSANWGGSVAK